LVFLKFVFEKVFVFESVATGITTGRSRTYLFFKMFKLIMESPL